MPLELLLSAYRCTPIGETSWVLSEGQTLKDFQIVVAAAEALESTGRIQILEMRKDGDHGLVNAVHIRRLI